MTSKRYTKRPVIIDAFAWNNEPVDDLALPEWFRAAEGKARIVEGPVSKLPELAIKTNLGEVLCKAGDYVIKSPSGELYPCDKHTFETLYETAPEMSGMSFEQAALSDAAVP